MKKIFTLLIALLLCSCARSYSEDIRKPAVEGAFYPADKDVLAKEVDGFLANAKKDDIKGKIIALIAPHAGYEYSGQIAAHSFKQLEGTNFKKIIIISPSHYVGFDGMSVYNKGAFETPLGLVGVDQELANKIIQKNKRFVFYPEAHQKEHAIEVEIPFLQRIYKDKDFKIVPIAMGNPESEDITILSDALYDVMDKDTLLIISVDLSHYYPYDTAVKLDTNSTSAIERLDAQKMLEDINSHNSEIDAPIAVLGMIMLANRYNAKAKIIKYANSGDVTGDKSRVVGYSSIVVYIPDDLQKKGDMIMKDEYLSKEEKAKLLEIAKFSIIEAVTGKRQFFPNVTEERLKENCGAFVTIKENNQLRGCIGYIQAVKPLYETIKDVAKSAAVNDYRFNPVGQDELGKLELEISVLTPLKKINDISEIEVGKHGLVMKKGFNSGLLLPQVATEYGWDRDTFLQETCRKAGLSQDAWKDKSTEIYTFSAEVFGENE
ncbi:MAG: AmmeMemoRadiSam system protein B [Candidatus Omnitrophota bacterium]|nr:AmmeMemoRadiSam system protein B [Candidatus Omnitrophota bacterium]